MARVALAAAAIFAAYNGLLAVARPQATPSIDNGTRNRVVAERYFDGGDVPAVIVGSSVAFRLSPDFLQGDVLGPSLYDLAIAGGSSASGIDIILHKARLPRMVFVEMNFGHRPADHGLLQEVTDEPRRTLRQFLPALRLENRPVDLLITLAWAGLRARITGNPDVEPTIPDFANRLAVTLSQNADVSGALRTEVQSGFDALKALVDALRARQIRVLLVPFPMHPEVAASPAQQYFHEQAQVHLPRDRYEWFTVPDAASYRTDDGLHLTRASGRRFAAMLRRYVEETP